MLVNLEINQDRDYKCQRLKKTNIRVRYGFSVHGQEEINAVVKVLKGNTALGDKTAEFEEKVAQLFGKKYGVMVNSGSSANLLAFELLDLPKGAEVITPILTFATTVAPIVQKGLVPVFVDIDPDTYYPFSHMYVILRERQRPKNPPDFQRTSLQPGGFFDFVRSSLRSE